MHKYFFYIKDNNTRIFFLNANLNKNFFFLWLSFLQAHLAMRLRHILPKFEFFLFQIKFYGFGSFWRVNVKNIFLKKTLFLYIFKQKTLWKATASIISNIAFLFHQSFFFFSSCLSHCFFLLLYLPPSFLLLFSPLIIGTWS